MIAIAIMALLMGGFTIHAEAQGEVHQDDQSNNNWRGNSNLNNVLSEKEIIQKLSEFESVIGKCESGNTELEKVEKQLKKLEGQNQKKASQRRVDSRRGTTQVLTNSPAFDLSERKAELLSKKEDLEKEYKTYYSQAKGLHGSLSRSKMGMSKDQKNQFTSLESRFNALPKRY